MKSQILFYPVDNGNMVLLKLNDNNQTTILFDIFIRNAADDDSDSSKFNVAKHLKENLKRDKLNRPYVDVFLLTHHDEDHIRGFKKHFITCDDISNDDKDNEENEKIVINEIWSSSRFWKKASESNFLIEDAKLFNKEIKKRVNLYKENQKIQEAGKRAIIICDDENNKTEGLEEITKSLFTSFSKINNSDLENKIKIYILGPIPKQEDEDIDDYKKSNRGSVVLSISVFEESYENKILLTGDAEMFVWEYIYNKFEKNLEQLSYDILLVPHHCSWYSIGYKDNNTGEKVLSENALNSLSQAKENSFIIASCMPIKDDDKNPPHYEAKEKYSKIKNIKEFICTSEYKIEDKAVPIIINLTENGPVIQNKIKSYTSENNKNSFTPNKKILLDEPRQIINPISPYGKN